MIHARRALAFGWVVAIALGAGATVAAAPPTPSPKAVQAKKAEVFDRPDFRSGDAENNTWLVRTLLAFFQWLGSLYAAAQGLFWFLLITCVVLLLAIAFYVAFAVRRVFVRGRVRRGAKDEHAERILLSVGYREDANRLAAAGEYTEAVRFLFLSLVYRFDERGRVSLHKAYTNREYLLLLGDRTPVRAALRVMVDTLDDHWYGQSPCAQLQYDECLAVYERLLASV